jgi:hypothetical protein
LLECEGFKYNHGSLWPKFEEINEQKNYKLAKLIDANIEGVKTQVE